MAVKEISALEAAIKSIVSRYDKKQTTLLKSDYTTLKAVVTAEATGSLEDYMGVLIKKAGGFGGTPIPNVPAPAANTQAPTVPIMLSPVIAQNSYTIRFLESVGPYDGAQSHPGVLNYDIERDGSVLSGTVDGTSFPYSAPHTNVQVDGTLINVGTGTGSSTRSNITEFDLGCPSGDETNGGFNPGPQHRITLQYSAYTSGNAISATLGNMTGTDLNTYPATYDGVGVGIFASTSTNAACIVVYQVPTALSKGIYVVERATNGATRVSSYSQGDGSTVSVAIIPITGNKYEIYKISSGGTASLLTTSSAITLGGSPVWGPFTFALGAAASGHLSQLAHRSATPISIAFSGTTNKTYRVRARAITSGTTSSYSSSVTGAGTVTPPVTTAGIRWNPGWYHMATDISHATTTNTGTRAVARRDEMATVKSNFSWIKGTQQAKTWRKLESTRGVYSDGDDDIDRDLAALPTGMKYILYILDGAVSTYSPSENSILPDYVHSNGVADFGWGFTADWASSDSVSGYVDMITHYINRYNDDPRVEGIYLIPETATGASTANAVTGLKAIVTNLANATNATRKMNLWVGVNYTYGGEAGDRSLIVHLRDNKFGWAAPDTFAPGTRLQGGTYTGGDPAAPSGFRNNTTAQNAAIGAYGDSDLRGSLPIMMEIQEPDLDPANTDFGNQWTSTQLFAHNKNVLASNHTPFAWYPSNGFVGNSSTTVSGMNAAYAAIGNTVQGCPTNYGGTCVLG